MGQGTSNDVVGGSQLNSPSPPHPIQDEQFMAECEEFRFEISATAIRASDHAAERKRPTWRAILAQPPILGKA